MRSTPLVAPPANSAVMAAILRFVVWDASVGRRPSTRRQS